jgi:hypothetical protein
MDPFVERKFKQLRDSLDEFGYRAALGIESLPLVERLFADLLQTTASLRDAKLAEHGKPVSSRDGGGLAVDIEPFQRDNARLVKVRSS